MSNLAQKLEVASSKIIKISSEQYHSDPAIGKSSLDKIARSPAHFIEYKKNPPSPTPAMLFGQAVHEIVLEPDLFARNYIVEPNIDKRTKAGKEEYESFLTLNHGKKILTRDQYSDISGILDSVYSHKIAKKLLSEGIPEQSFFWNDTDTGIACKARPDFLRDGHIIVDVKTTEDASPSGFQKSIANFRYHVQGAFYTHGASMVTGQKYDTFVLVAVEKKAPYAVAVYVLDQASLEQGTRAYQKNLRTYAECLKTNYWPAYSDEIQPITLPGWVDYE